MTANIINQERNESRGLIHVKDKVVDGAFDIPFCQLHDDAAGSLINKVKGRHKRRLIDNIIKQLKFRSGSLPLTFYIFLL